MDPSQSLSESQSPVHTSQNPLVNAALQGLPTLVMDAALEYETRAAQETSER